MGGFYLNRNINLSLVGQVNIAKIYLFLPTIQKNFIKKWNILIKSVDTKFIPFKMLNKLIEKRWDIQNLFFYLYGVSTLLANLSSFPSKNSIYCQKDLNDSKYSRTIVI